MDMEVADTTVEIVIITQGPHKVDMEVALTPMVEVVLDMEALHHSPITTVGEEVGMVTQEVDTVLDQVDMVLVGAEEDQQTETVMARTQA